MIYLLNTFYEICLNSVTEKDRYESRICFNSLSSKEELKIKPYPKLFGFFPMIKYGENKNKYSSLSVRYDKIIISIVQNNIKHNLLIPVVSSIFIVCFNVVCEYVFNLFIC